MRKLALLIGVSKYDPDFDALPSAVRDVKAVQKILKDPCIGQFSEEDITVLINESEQKIQAEIYELFTHRSQDDLLLLYFSGHAVINSKNHIFIAATDTQKYEYGGELIESTAIPASFIREKMDASKSQKKVVILDCCFTGAFKNDKTKKNKVDINIKAELGGKGRAIFTSANSIYYPFKEDKELSTYTNYFVEGIESGAADLNQDGWITLEEINYYVRSQIRKNIPNMTPQFYPIEEGHVIRLAKVAPKSIDEENISSTSPLFQIELQTRRKVDYSTLRNLLAAQNWRQADLETRKLMLQAAGKKEAELLLEEDINKISSVDLRTVDSLWLVSSGGRFGFSVQKDIWKQIGRKVDYGTECELGDRVGWRINNAWLIYSQLTFNLTALPGHLPCLGVSLVRIKGSIGGYGRFPISSYIAQRFAKCE